VLEVLLAVQVVIMPWMTTSLTDLSQLPSKVNLMNVFHISSVECFPQGIFLSHENSQFVLLNIESRGALFSFIDNIGWLAM
jgi:hypothetical protein